MLFVPSNTGMPYMIVLEFDYIVDHYRGKFIVTILPGYTVYILLWCELSVQPLSYFETTVLNCHRYRNKYKVTLSQEENGNKCSSWVENDNVANQTLTYVWLVLLDNECFVGLHSGTCNLHLVSRSCTSYLVSCFITCLIITCIP